MKIYIRFFLLCISVFGAVALLHAEDSKDLFKMETFFPVPYVVYDEMLVGKELQMNLRSDPVINTLNALTEAYSLEVRNMELAEGVNNGEPTTLQIYNIHDIIQEKNDGGISMGSSIDTTGQLSIQFAHLKINKISGTLTNAEASNMRTNSVVYLYADRVKDSRLPACSRAGWRKFPTNGQECGGKMFFVCLDHYKEPFRQYYQWILQKRCSVTFDKYVEHTGENGTATERWYNYDCFGLTGTFELGASENGTASSPVPAVAVAMAQALNRGDSSNFKFNNICNTGEPDTWVKIISDPSDACTGEGSRGIYGVGIVDGSVTPRVENGSCSYYECVKFTEDC